MVLACAALSAPARAEGGRAEADRLFEQGKAALRAGDWTRACRSFRDSFEHDASVSTSVKIARCYEHEGKSASALLEYRRALELNRTLSQAPERARELGEVVRRALAELEPKVPRLSARITPAAESLEVRLDGRVVPFVAGEPLLVDPGEHVLSVSAARYREAKLEVSLAPGETREVELQLVAEPPPAAPKAIAPAPAPAQKTEIAALPRPAPPPQAESRPGSSRRTWGFVLGGAGIAALGAATYFGVRTAMLVDEADASCDLDRGECDREGGRLIEEAHGTETAAWVLAGVGAAATGAGVVLLLSAPKAARAEAGAAAGLAVRLRPGGVSFGGRF
ncbi:MAG TPA: hypothetical protein VGK73_06165 [Polyangiaceae bacterium]